jgi:hypothetical protein
MLEMKVETELIRKSLRADAKMGFLHSEMRGWARLFEKKHIDRTLIGVLMMVFQREFIRF